MKNYEINVNKEQLTLINSALDFYSRIGCLDLTHLFEHESIYGILSETTKDSGIGVSELIEECQVQVKTLVSLIEGEYSLGHLGISSPKVSNTSRDAFDLYQIFRHQLWKENPKRSSVTVDSSVYLCNKKNNNVTISCNDQ